MNRPRFRTTGPGWFAALAVVATPIAHAAPPAVTGITPFGLQRGVAADLTLTGSSLGGNPRLIAPFAFTLGTAPAGSDAANVKLKVTVDPGTPVGVYPVRVQTDDGLSNPLLFAVGQLPQVAEVEDNSLFDKAQAFTAPAVIEGQAAGNDVDYFRFAGKKGQKVLVDAQCARVGSGVDPSIRLTMADRTFVASADDTPGLLTDARLVATLPADADYVVELSDSRYQGGGRPIYRLVVGEVPSADEVFPIGGRRGETVGLELRGGTLDGTKITAATLNPAAGLNVAPFRATSGALGLGGTLDLESVPSALVSDAAEIREPNVPNAAPPKGAVPVVFNGRIDPAGDEDRFVVAVVAGQKYRVEVEAAEAGSALDGVLQVLNAQGGVIATADDTNLTPRNRQNAQAPPSVSPDPSVEFTAPAGQTEVTLALKDLERRGGLGFPYRISVTPVTPTFDLILNDPQISVPKGGSAAVGVTLVRKGFAGPVTLNVLNPPAGLTARPGKVADGQLLGAFTVAAAPDANLGPVTLDVVGEAAGPAGPVVSRATKVIVFAQQATLPTNTLTQQGLAAATATANPLALDAPADPVEVAHGFGATVKVTATRPPGSEGALALATLPLPPGLTVPAAKFEDKATEANIALNTTTDHPLGAVSVVLTAKGKVAGAERTLTLPAVTVQVVKPATVETAAPAVEVKAGGTIEVKGKVVRKGAFKDPVTVKVNGLPAGTKVDPVTVPADQSDFTLKLVADEKAAAATGAASVALAFQVNKKDYPAPTAPLSVKVLPK